VVNVIIIGLASVRVPLRAAELGVMAAVGLLGKDAVNRFLRAPAP